MRLFALLNLQHVAAFVFPALLFLVIFGVGLAFAHFHSSDAEDRKTRIINRTDGIEDRDAPFPLVMVILLAGIFIWGFFYILMHGLLGVKI